MFGNNPIRGVTRDPNSLAIEDIFYTIQGEGPLSGMPALFIRTAGCNLACHFCDTQFERFADVPVSLMDLKLRIEDIPVDQRRTVVLTGGEPLRQDVTGLIAWLLNNGTWCVQIETAGTVWPGAAMTALMERYDDSERILIVCSPKTASVHADVQKWTYHYKYIIRAGELAEDGLPNRGTQSHNKDAEVKLFRPSAVAMNKGMRQRSVVTIWVSPCDDIAMQPNKANLMAAVHSALEFGYRVSLQAHKIMMVP